MSDLSGEKVGVTYIEEEPGDEGGPGSSSSLLFANSQNLHQARYYGGIAVKGALYIAGLPRKCTLRAQALKYLKRDVRRAVRFAQAYLDQGGTAPLGSPEEKRRLLELHSAMMHASRRRIGGISP